MASCQCDRLNAPCMSPVVLDRCLGCLDGKCNSVLTGQVFGTQVSVHVTVETEPLHISIITNPHDSDTD